MTRKRHSPEKHEVRGRIIHETPNAILVSVEFNAYGQHIQKEVWLPLSTVNSIHRTFATLGYDTLFIDYWIARDRGIVHDDD